MFQFSGFALLSEYYIFNVVGCPIRISADLIVCANPRSFSQLITSFFASESHRHPPYALILLIVLVSVITLKAVMLKCYRSNFKTFNIKTLKTTLLCFLYFSTF